MPPPRKQTEDCKGRSVSWLLIISERLPPENCQTLTRILQRAETLKLQGGQKSAINTAGYSKQLDTIPYKNLGVMQVHVPSALSRIKTFGIIKTSQENANEPLIGLDKNRKQKRKKDNTLTVFKTASRILLMTLYTTQRMETVFYRILQTNINLQ